MPLDRLHYEVFFENIDTKEPNLLNFFAKAEVDFHPRGIQVKPFYTFRCADVFTFSTDTISTRTIAGKRSS